MKNRRKAIIQQINDLLDVCKSCSKHNSGLRHISKINEVCGGCQTFEDLRYYGDSLKNGSYKEVKESRKEEKKVSAEKQVKQTEKKVDQKKYRPIPKRLDMSIDEFVKFKESGYSDKRIADEKGVKLHQVAYWKEKNMDKINVILQSSNSSEGACPDYMEKYLELEKKHNKFVSESKVIVDTLTKKLISAEELFESAMVDKENAHKENVILKNEIEKLKNQLGDINNLNSACDDLELELSRLMKENKALRELLQLWI